eukprot:g32639.t1
MLRPHGVPTAAVALILVLQTSQWLVSDAGWVVASTGDSCQTTCTGLGQSCAVSQMQLVLSETQMDFAISDGSQRACDIYAADDASYATSQPYQIKVSDSLPIFCFSNGGSSDCTASVAELDRLCCCWSGAGVPNDECPIPTTTTTTLTTSSSTTASSTATTMTSVTTTMTTSTETTSSQTTTSRRLEREAGVM